MQDSVLEAFQVPKLFSLLLRRLGAAQPSSPAAIIRALQSELVTAEADYFKSVSKSFQQLVAEISTSGFPLPVSDKRQGANYQEGSSVENECLTFAVPQIDGSAFELFPGGSRIVVTPSTWENFLALYGWYKSAPLPFGSSSTPPRLWPLQQHLHLMSDYSILLKAMGFIGSAALNVSDEEWHAHRVTYCVPFAGLIHDLRKNGRELPVSKRDIGLFVAEALEKLAQLAAACKGGSALKPLPPPMKAPLMGQQLSLSKLNAFPLLLEALAALNTPSGDQFSAEEFAGLGLCYFAPVHGKLIALLPGESTKPVGLADLPKFVELVRSKLGLIQRQMEPVSLRQQFFKLGISDLSTTLAPSSFVCSLSATVAGSPARGRSYGFESDLSLLSSIFRQTAAYLAKGRFDPAEVDSLELRFFTYSAKAKVMLMENGDDIPVTSANISEFLRLTEKLAKTSSSEVSISPVGKPNPEPPELLSESVFWELIGLLEEGHVPVEFDTLGYRFALSFPNGRTLLLKENGNAYAVVRENLGEFVRLAKEKRELIHLSFLHSAGAQKTAATLVPSPASSQLQKFDKSKWNCALSASWNSVQLRESSLLSPVFSLILGLSEADTVFSDEDMDRMHLTYCIPLPNGDKYDLVPNGRNIPVTKELRQDFVQRVSFEKNRIESKRQQRKADIAVGRTPSSSMSRSIGTVPLTAKQIQSLVQMKSKFEALQAMPHVTEEQWVQLGLVYCIRCEDAAFDVIPEGRKIPATYANRQSYVAMTISKIQEILQDQEERRNIVVPPVTREQRDMYSPGHFALNLFSPLQVVTTRSIPQGQIISEVLEAASASSSPQPPALAASSTLADFLACHALSPLLPILEGSGVSTYSELCELHESDLQFITNVVSRRRLIDAAKLRK